MTTTVVAYTSRREGHVTRRISLRTSVRKLREFSHHPLIPPSVLRTGAGLTCSSVLMTASLAAISKRPGIRDQGQGDVCTPTPHPWSLLPDPDFPSAIVAGQEGLEPPALGFGDRCSTN